MRSFAQAHLVQLGENLGVARKRRKESIRAWAERIWASEPTVSQMKRVDSSVSMGV